MHCATSSSGLCCVLTAVLFCFHQDVFRNISPTANIIVNPAEIYEERRLKNEFVGFGEQTQIDNNDNCMTKYYDVPSTLKKPGKTYTSVYECQKPTI